MEERIQKILAHAGLGSRRSCEAYITDGRITVNGKLAELGSKADPEVDTIRLDGEVLKSAESLVYVAINKPLGVVSSLRAQGERQTVRDLVPLPQRLYPVGRLDVDSYGLMLLTNDGDLTERLTHPRYGVEKEYRVLLNKKPSAEQLTAWRRGVTLEEGYVTQPAQVVYEPGDKTEHWLRITMHEGRKRQIREVAGALGLYVRKLVRIRLGNLRLGTLKPGEWRKLEPAEVRGLQALGARAGKKPGRAKRPPTARRRSSRSEKGGR